MSSTRLLILSEALTPSFHFSAWRTWLRMPRSQPSRIERRKSDASEQGAFRRSSSRWGCASSWPARRCWPAGTPQGQSGTGSVLVIGVVKDGTSQGWPLYAKLVVFRAGEQRPSPSSPIRSPATTRSSWRRASSTTSWSPPSRRATFREAARWICPRPAQNAVVASWSLFPAPSCNAPGFGPGSFVPPLVLSEGFDGGVIPPGWTVEHELRVRTGRSPREPIRAASSRETRPAARVPTRS